MAFLLLSSFLVCFAFAVAFYKPAKIPAEEHVISARPHEYLSLDQLPDNFDWKLMNGTVYVTRVGNQLQPHPCGSCWLVWWHCPMICVCIMTMDPGPLQRQAPCPTE
eukprot:m.55994 g.55994  ORF g.55994 m.55994 type:complete len:107 (+) comp34531_c0_seq6:40-360(+)